MGLPAWLLCLAIHRMFWLVSLCTSGSSKFAHLVLHIGCCCDEIKELSREVVFLLSSDPARIEVCHIPD